MKTPLILRSARRVAKDKHAELTEMLNSCIRLTQKEVLDAGTSLAVILDEGERQLEELTGLSKEFEDADDQDRFGAVVTRVRRLLQSVTDMVSEITVQSNEIEGQAAEIDTGARGLAPLVNTMRDISSRARLLALNARIEAAGGTSDGKTLVALAEEMKVLAHKATDSAGLMEDLSEVLGVHLTKMSASVRTIGEQCTTSRAKLQSGGGTLQGSYDGAIEAVRAAVGSAQERSARVQREYYVVLGKLQFQDRVAQTLQLANSHVDRVEHFIEAVLDAVEATDEDSPLREAIIHAFGELDASFLEDRCEPAIDREHAVTTEDEVASGDMMFL